MGKSYPIGGKVSPDCALRVVAFLRRAHPAKTAECVAGVTGLDADRIKKWLGGAAEPSFRAVLTLIMAYGPEFLAEVLGSAPGWLSDAARAARQAALEADMARLARQMERP